MYCDLFRKNRLSFWEVKLYRKVGSPSLVVDPFNFFIIAQKLKGSIAPFAKELKGSIAPVVILPLWLANDYCELLKRTEFINLIGNRHDCTRQLHAHVDTIAYPCGYYGQHSINNIASTT